MTTLPPDPRVNDYQVYALRATTTMRRVLMARMKSEPDGAWRDIATFDNDTDAEWVLKMLQDHDRG